MQYKNTRRGFTLIELLVGVLIIGILAAVALPQYNKAVRKSRGAEALASVEALDKALAVYYLEHGSYPKSASDEGYKTFAIELPELKHFRYSIGTGCDDATSPTFQYTYNLGSSGSKFGMDWCIDKASLGSVWEGGKQTSLYCTGELCTDYFNCEMKTYTVTQNTGSSVYTNTYTRCFFN